MDAIPLNGLDFIEFSGPEPKALAHLFEKMGFALSGSHKRRDLLLYAQGDCRFIINREKTGHAHDFMQKRGGGSVPSMGWRVKIPSQEALAIAKARGARAAEDSSGAFPALYGVGGSLIYLVDNYKGPASHWAQDFSFKSEAIEGGSAGLLAIDHLTNNVPVGEMDRWCEFYASVFDFTQRRYFDIQGLKTGLVSKVMRSPCDSVTIPINEPSPDERGKKSQIQEYLDEYKGAGIQHIALSTKSILSAVSVLRSQGLGFLKTPDTYYEALKSRLPIIKEDTKALQKQGILADGDKETYLLQIFTKNVIGPVFFEIIERHGHEGFGEGNFQALFDAIERDQMKRGYL